MIDSILKKPKFIILSIKRNIIPIVFLLFTICLVIFSKTNLTATKDGILLWVNNIVPSLLPFFIATELLSYTNIISKMEKFLTPIMRPLFNVPGSGAYAFIMGIISGYPIGAKIVTDFRKNDICTKEECERLLAFTNNSGPLFIIGTVGLSMFFNSTIGLLLFITHLLSCMTVGILFRFWKKKASKHIINNSMFKEKNINSSAKKNVTFSNLGEVISKSITSAISSIFMIGGFVVFFSVILSILRSTGLLNMFTSILSPILNIFGINNIDFSVGISSGILELTNGLKIITSTAYKNISANIVISAFLLGFGGISILLQVFGIISKTDISIKPYIIGKFLHGIFACIYTYIFINMFPVFNLNL